jgi:histone deacetylase 11
MRKKIILFIIIILIGFLAGCVFWPVTVIEMNFKDTKLTEGQLPIVYSDHYDITFFGMERLHPFDSRKYSKTHDYLVENKIVRKEQFIEPGVPSDEDLLLVHPQWYLDTLRHSETVADYAELGFLSYFPSFLTRKKVLVPMLYATGGSVLAANLAFKKGWAINLSGGYHHASKEEGGGFCVYADITLIVHYLRKHNPMVQKFMIIDLDAHQGNGHERDFLNDSNVFIVDMYNYKIYPNDTLAKKAIAIKGELEPGIGSEKYLGQLEFHLNEAFDQFKPDMVIYNAGTDILEGDPLGRMSVSAGGVIQRDEKVFRHALMEGAPIVMLLSGGYQKNNYEVIGRSIANLKNKFRLF